jgi:ribonuclease HI
VFITDARGRARDSIARGIGVATNNVAEYTAAIEGLRRVKSLGAARVLLRSDSRLLIEQLAGRFRVKNPTLQRLHKEVRDLTGSFRDVAFEHVPREENREADRLANQGVDAWLAGEGASWAPPKASPRLWDSGSERS